MGYVPAIRYSERYLHTYIRMDVAVAFSANELRRRTDYFTNDLPPSLEKETIGLRLLEIRLLILQNRLRVISYRNVLEICRHFESGGWLDDPEGRGNSIT